MPSVNPKARQIPDGFLHTSALHILSSMITSTPYHKYMRKRSERNNVEIEDQAVSDAYDLAERLFVLAELHES